jgi:3-dehydroquinate dehydratase II
MKIGIVNGPNLNLLGKREVDLYGNRSFKDYQEKLALSFPGVEFQFCQSNVEGELINFLHAMNEDLELQGILLNAGGYTHTSVAMGDAVAGIDKPVVEIHISNIFAREEFRHKSYIGRAAIGSISGFGLGSYDLGVLAILKAVEH